MEIFGVGPLEFLLILVIALVILGPEDMVGTARKIGRWIYRTTHSPTWRAIIESTQDLRDLPNQIVRDAGLQEAVNEVKQTASDVRSQMADTTREISGEMSAATRAINSEMTAASGDVAKDLKDASSTAMLTNAEISAATPKTAMEAGESAPEPEIVLPGSNADGSDPNALVTPDGENGAAAAAAEIPLEDGAAATSAATEVIPIETPALPAPSTDPYVAGLESFAQALGISKQDLQSAEPGENAPPSAAMSAEPSSPEPMDYMPPQLVPPEPQGASAPLEDGAEAPVQQHWAAGVTPWATSAPSETTPEGGSDFEARMQDRMAEMLKSFEKLEQASPSPAPPEETPAQPEENTGI